MNESIKVPDDQLPSARDFILAIPLYAEFAFSNEGSWKVVDILYFGGTYDSYCTKCCRDSTFQVDVQKRPDELVRRREMEKYTGKTEAAKIPAGIHRIQAKCTRQNYHAQDFIFLIEYKIEKNDLGEYVTLSKIQKIGQQPSFGDVHLANVKKYASVLTKDRLGELSRAIGLASHDVGIGSYVYLRRVFEALVEESHSQAVNDVDWDDEKYSRCRMAEKIAMLRRHLPDFLGEHPEMYSLLSKGVHELSEKECLTHFETLRIGIELILDEKLEHKQRARKIKDAKTALAKAIAR